MTLLINNVHLIQKTEYWVIVC